jgi:hypothetical protein
MEEDAAEVTAILKDEDVAKVTHDDNGDGHCLFCEDGEPCRTRFENNAANVATEAAVPLLSVMMWMDEQSIKSLEEARQAARAALILDKYRPLFFGGAK